MLPYRNKTDQMQILWDKNVRKRPCVKHVLKNLIFLLRSASEMETVYMYWVNRSRRQFVLETKSTALENVMFKDRLQFEEHFLNEYKDITEPKAVEVGEKLREESLKHYYNEVPVRNVTMLPFVNNGETVAMTVLESKNNHRRSKRGYSFLY